MKNKTIKIAQKALASFLKQPIDDISCAPLTGGSDEANIVKSHHKLCR